MDFKKSLKDIAGKIKKSIDTAPPESLALQLATSS
jgi:hypothetical protein